MTQHDSQKPRTATDAMNELRVKAERRVRELERENAELREALRPFANYACDEPHIDEPACHNCIARAALAKVSA